MDSLIVEDRGPGKNKMKWTKSEEDKLIKAMFNVVTSGNHKVTNGFKPGFYNAVEIELNVKLLGAGIRAKPHIGQNTKKYLF